MGQDAGFHRQVLLGIRAYAGHAKRWLFHNAPPTLAAMRPLAEWNPTASSPIWRREGRPRDPQARQAGGRHGLRADRAGRSRRSTWITRPSDRLAAEYFLTRGYRHFGYFGSGRALLPVASGELSRGCRKGRFAVRSCHVEYLPRLPDRDQLEERQRTGAALAEGVDQAGGGAGRSRRAGPRSGRHVPTARPARARRRGHPRRGRRRVGMPVGLSARCPAWRFRPNASASRRPSCSIACFAGKRVPKESVFLPPVRVVTRHSTSMFAVDEPIVTAALHYIRNHLAEPLRVEHHRRRVGRSPASPGTEVPHLAGAFRAGRNPSRTRREGQGTVGEHRPAHLQGGGAVGLLNPSADGHGLPQNCWPGSKHLPSPNVRWPTAVKRTIRKSSPGGNINHRPIELQLDNRVELLPGGRRNGDLNAGFGLLRLDIAAAEKPAGDDLLPPRRAVSRVPRPASGGCGLEALLAHFVFVFLRTKRR